MDGYICNIHREDAPAGISLFSSLLTLSSQSLRGAGSPLSQENKNKRDFTDSRNAPDKVQRKGTDSKRQVPAETVSY